MFFWNSLAFLMIQQMLAVYVNYISTNWKKYNMKKVIVTSFIRLLVKLTRTMNENYLAWDSP